jgi:hypothetical protein
LPGIYAAYIPGYLTASVSPENVSAIGELAAVRENGGIGKAYVWVFGISGNGVFFNGPYKFFDGHHFPDTGSIPVEQLFGNVHPVAVIKPCLLSTVAAHLSRRALLKGRDQFCFCQRSSVRRAKRRLLSSAVSIMRPLSLIFILCTCQGIWNHCGVSKKAQPTHRRNTSACHLTNMNYPVAKFRMSSKSRRFAIAVCFALVGGSIFCTYNYLYDAEASSKLWGWFKDSATLGLAAFGAFRSLAKKNTITVATWEDPESPLMQEVETTGSLRPALRLVVRANDDELVVTSFTVSGTIQDARVGAPALPEEVKNGLRFVVCTKTNKTQFEMPTGAKSQEIPVYFMRSDNSPDAAVFKATLACALVVQHEEKTKHLNFIFSISCVVPQLGPQQ